MCSCAHPSHSAGGRGVTRSSRIPAGAGPSSDEHGRDREAGAPFPAAASASRARCTVRWLAPSASARAELDHDSPSARKASTAGCAPSTGGARTTTVTGAARRKGESSLRRAERGEGPEHGAKPPGFDAQPRPMRFVGGRAPNARATSGPSARLRATLAQRAREGEQHRPPSERDHRRGLRARRGGTRPRRAGVDAGSASTSSSRSEPLLAPRDQAGRGRAQREERALDLRHQSRDTGLVARRARPGPGPRAPPSSGARRRAIPATTSS